MICLQEETESESEDSSIASESDGMSTNMEAKIHFKASNLPQVVATTVVSSFRETANHPNIPSIRTTRANHPNKSPLIPTIFINQTLFVVCLYDSEKDILLISNKKSLCTKSRSSQSEIALLWVVLHHR